MAEKKALAASAREGARWCAARRLRLQQLHPGKIMLAALALLVAVSPNQGSGAADGMRVAQQVQPSITVAPTILAEPASQASLAIDVGPVNALPPNSFVRIRGLPGMVSLNVGYAITAGAWAVPLFGLATLKINVPASVAGRADITVSLMTIDGAQLAEARTALVVGPPAAPAAEPKSAAIPVAPGAVPAARTQRDRASAAPALSGEARIRAEHMLAQGERYLDQGNITPARQFFRLAADAGLAQAAMRLAATYDAAELRRMSARGMVADPGEARRWYERARELGAPGAEARLARLGPGS